MGYWEDKIADFIGEDLDVALAYQTMKLVRIRDRCVKIITNELSKAHLGVCTRRYLGFTHKGLMIAVVLYIIGFVSAFSLKSL